MTNDATNGTMEIEKMIATITMTIRHARFMFMAPPFRQIRIWAYSIAFSLFFAPEQP